ncbi:MAG: xanthine dehydrogenase family protein molybdopterin-binding subunit [Rhodospirillales bacterium]|jgi:carbon-monoxide dehydrogenase large subunit
MSPLDDISASVEKYSIGQPVSRKEDPVLVKGQGRYADDNSLPGQTYAVMVRSSIAHGFIRGINTEDAKAMPGVLAIITGQDLIDAGYGSMSSGPDFKNRDGSSMAKPEQPPLTIDKVRFVGDPVACVVAETRAQAEDAAESIFLDVESLPAVTSAEAGVANDAASVHESVQGNIVLDFHHGDGAAVAAAFEKAAHVVSMKIWNSRIAVAPMEPRSALANIEDGRYVLRLGCQGAFPMRNNLSKPLKTEAKDIRVLIGNVGGSFGMKSSCYPEYIAILYAAKLLGRPVKWTDKRSESFLSDSHGRGHDMRQEAAFDSDGRITAIRISGFGTPGAYLSNGTVMQPTGNVVKNTISVYATPLQEVSTRCVFTNTTPVGPYRGAGRPESNYYIERILDTAAKEMGIDRVEIRRRNHITPNMLPYKTPANTVYDSGDFPAILDKALVDADWAGFSARRLESKARGKLRGIGIGQYLEVTGPPGNEMGGIRFEEDGTVSIVTGTLDYGQGHASTFAQILTTLLGIPFEKIRLIQGDSDELIAGTGTGGSRSTMHSGKAIFEASELVKEKGRKLAAHMLEAAVDDIEFTVADDGGKFRIAGTDRTIGIMELATVARSSADIPDDLEADLSVSHIAEGPPFSYPNGCHIAEVEVDPETGVVEVVSYVMVNDFGVVVNPMLVAGQAHGGVAQGIGQALMEEVVFDEEGQPLTGSFMDYAMPRADHMPDMSAIDHLPSPAKTNPLGVKGCGEAGCAGAMPSVMNALIDALSDYGITHIDMPATPMKVWEAIQAAKS